ncbi:hypothetical protein [Panacibacter ginsenosidivorans]|uniref:hypothetical protein n=1 Tax=Panacibacter ginsenosidivorans TaxID=1813871 RepID=UPI001CEFA4E3|nr:hypothetical protein [Panacibacter ginsenosidivorans]
MQHQKTILNTFIIATAFISGFAFKAMLVQNNNEAQDARKITGIGGIFFKCKDSPIWSRV